MARSMGLLSAIVMTTLFLVRLISVYVSLRLYSLELRFRYWLWRRRFSRCLARSGVPRAYREKLVKVYGLFLESQRLRLPGLLGLLGAELGRTRFSRPERSPGGHWDGEELN
ncbi:hypothetical protein [Pyrofollis japonicus]|uniref:hypothetical protein n=1 Tax=Pyrofollis japonicus TaxID=3060460 RepID=UPI00295BA576|nr:hypothetical protein [Pyrofollis japonicus]